MSARARTNTNMCVSHAHAHMCCQVAHVWENGQLAGSDSLSIKVTVSFAKFEVVASYFWQIAPNGLFGPSCS